MINRLIPILFVFLHFSLPAQFLKIDVNTVGITSMSFTRSGGDNDLIALFGGELIHITRTVDSAFLVEYIEGTLPSLHKFVTHDIDRDGDLDIICYQYEIGIFHVYLKTNGKYHYYPEWNIPGTKAHNLVSKDFDGDGIDDLMINDNVFLNSGVNERTYVDRFYGAQDNGYRDVQFWDYDEDGDTDILLNSALLKMLKNNGPVLAANIIVLNQEVGSPQWSARIQTTDGKKSFYYDSDLDSIRQITWNGDEYSFRNIAKTTFGSNAEMTLYDLDKDGTEEIIYAAGSMIIIFRYDVASETGSVINFNSGGPINSLGILETSEGPGFFTGNATDFRFIDLDDNLQPLSTKVIPVSITGNNEGFKDFDGDGFVDIISGNNLQLYLGDGQFGPIRKITYPSTNGDLKDYDGDSDLDYVKEEEWFANLGNFTFGPSIPIVINDPTPDPQILFTREILREDMDGDGDLDILTYNSFAEPLQLLENNANTFFEDPVTIATSDDIVGEEVYVDVLDLDQDGILDILMAASSGMIMFRGNPGLQFDAPLALYKTDHSPITVRVRDINGDDFPDILLGTRIFDAGSVYGEVIFYLGTDNMPNPSTVHSGDGSHKAEFGNINSEGWLDIVYIHEDGIFWSKTSTGNSFITEQIDVEFFLNEDIVVTDVNNDGDDDVIGVEGIHIFYYLNGDSGNSVSNCPEGDLYYFSQEQVNRYRSLYGNCEVLEGSLFIQRDLTGSPDIVDLSSFIKVKEVKGNLEIRNNNLLPDLTGFSNLERIGGSFYLGNPYAPDIHGIEKLRFVGKDFTIYGMFTENEPGNLIEFQNLNTIKGNVTLRQSHITSMTPLIQSVFEGDLFLKDVFGLSDVESLDEIDTIKGVLTIDNTQWNSLASFSNLKFVKGLVVRNNDALTQLSFLNNMTHIDSILQIESNFSLTANTGLNSLRSVGGDFYLYNDDCSLFKSLESITGHASILVGSLDELSFANLETVGGNLWIGRMEQQDFHQFQKIESINGSLYLTDNKVSSLIGLHNITRVAEDLSITYNPQLPHIDELNESLEVEGKWEMFFNDNLQYCNTIPLCNHLAKGGAYDISNNGVDCSDISRIRCVDQFFSGFVYHDFNQNMQKDPTEAVLPNIRISNDHQQETMITAANGYYSYHALNGDSFNIEMDVPDDWAATGESIIQVDSFVPGAANNYGNNFGLFPQFQKHDLSLSYHQSLFRCDHTFDLEINVANNGTYQDYGLVTVEYPEYVILDPSFSDFLTHNPLNRLITFEWDTIYPFFSKKIVVPFMAPSADLLDFDFHSIIRLFAKYDLELEVVAEEDFKSELRCAFDPNDKQVRSTNGTSDIHYNSEDALIYTIRFQNTGNLHAETVRIVDTLSAHLDLSTLSFIGSSHPVEIRQDGRVLYFHFYDIQLPDSLTDYVGSQGYVMFSIKPSGAVAIGNEIDNKADIYFDYNDPILTNLVRSVVVDPTGIDVLVNESYGVYPNPAEEWVTIFKDGNVADHFSQYSIINLSGLQLSSGAMDQALINVSGLIPGIYSIRLIDDSGKFESVRFIKL